MSALAAIGLLVLFLASVLLTFVAASIAVSEKGWSGSLSSLSWTFLTLACALWVLFFWLQPFSISLEIAP